MYNNNLIGQEIDVEVLIQGRIRLKYRSATRQLQVDEEGLYINYKKKRCPVEPISLAGRFRAIFPTDECSQAAA